MTVVMARLPAIVFLEIGLIHSVSLLSFSQASLLVMFKGMHALKPSELSSTDFEKLSSAEMIGNISLMCRELIQSDLIL